VDVGNLVVVNLDMGPDLTVNEGDTVVLTPTIIDPLGRDNPFSYLWRVEASNGQVVTEGHDATFDFKPFDNGVYKVRLFVTDVARGLTAEPGQVIITSLNVAPAVEAGIDQTVNEGDPLSVNMLFSDVGTNDSHSAVIDWGDKTTSTLASLVELLGAGNLSTNHVFADNGSYVVSVTLTDDDGGTAMDSFNVTVNNVVPTVFAGADQTVLEGQNVRLNRDVIVNLPFIGQIVFPVEGAGFNDRGTLDTHTATIDWGDGTQAQSGTLSELLSGPPGSTPITASTR
jgi:PKD repeat protein